MANDLKKVGLIFKADGSADFIKSNQAVNAVLKENYQQFRLTQSQWDSSTKTSEKLRDKMQYLTQAYDIQNDKVRILKTELKELQSNEQSSTVEIEKKKAAVAQAEAELGRYQKQMNATSKEIKSGTADLKDFAKKLDDTGDKLVSTGKKASVFSAAYAAATGLAIKASVDFESAIAGVNKTIDGTPKQLAEIKQGIRDMAKEIPASTTEIAAVAEAAGQLGIQTDNVLAFSRVMIDLGNATSMSAEEAATTLARFANVTRMSQNDFSKLGSSIVALGNNFATTESEISAMAMNLGSAGTQIGMSQSDILALAASLSSVGLEAQAGGTAFSKLMIEMQLATETGSDALADFANVAGMSADEFAHKFKTDATGAVMAFIEGLSKTDERGASAIKVLDDMGISETRLRDALLRSANASDIFSDAIGLSSQAWEENTALTDEASQRYATTESQMILLKNSVNDLAISFGDLLLPKVQAFVDFMKNIVDAINNLSPAMKSVVLFIGSLVAAIGPLLIIIGKMAHGVSALMKAFILLKPIVAPIFVALKAAVVGFAATLGLPVAAVVAIGAAIAALVVVVVKYWDEIKAFTISAFNAISETVSGVISGMGQHFANFKDSVTSVIESIKLFFTESFASIETFFKEIFNNISIFVAEWIAIISENFNAFIAKIMEMLALPIEYLKNAAILIVAVLAMMLETIYTTIIAPLVAFFVGAFETIKTNIETTIANVVEFFQTSFNTIQTNVTATLNGIYEFFTNIFDWINQNVMMPFQLKMTEIFNSIKQVVSSFIEGTKAFFMNGFEWVKNNVVQPLVGFFGGVFNSIFGVINGAILSIQNAFSNMKNYVLNMFTAVRDSVALMFNAIGNIIKAPINGIIGLINNVLSSLNRIKVPSWVPGIGGSSVNFPMVNYLQTGGDLLEGAAIVGEAGPEMLMQSQGRSTVVPLTESGKHNATSFIDYEKLGAAVANAMRLMKFTIDDDGIGRFVDERMLGVIQ